jgi:hypothetical protein
MSDQDHEARPRESRLDIAVAVLLAIVAVTAALAAWRTSVVGSNVADINRAGLIDISKQTAMHHVTENSVYTEAQYAVEAALKAAEAGALLDSGNPALVAAGQSMTDNLIPSIEQVAGPFPSGEFLTTNGTFDVAARVAAIEGADKVYQDVVPEASFSLADDYSNEKRWLTVLSVVLAIALFWLGMAEITSGRWRIVNLVAGVAIWVVTVGMFIVVEAWFIAGRGGSV